MEQITTVDPVTGERLHSLSEVVVFPATHYVAGEERMRQAIEGIETELQERWPISRRRASCWRPSGSVCAPPTTWEMMQEIGFCNGIENYSRHIDGRSPGERPYTLLDYFPDDFITVIDESHVAVPQLHGQYEGDRSRKNTLVDHGFRLPSAVDNAHCGSTRSWSGWARWFSCRPLPATMRSACRPGGGADRAPPAWWTQRCRCAPTKGQIDDLMKLIEDRTERGQRVLVTTLTKKMAEDLTEYLLGVGVLVRYLHSEWTPSSELRSCGTCGWGEFDVLCASTSAGGARPTPRFRWWPSWMPTRRGSCVVRPR